MIHPTAIIESPFKMGKDVFIGAYVVIRHGANIGDGVVIGHGTVIEPRVTIEARCRIQAQCFISPDTELAEDVFVGPGVRFLNDRRILSHDRPGGGHSCLDAPTVLRGARIGANSTIGPGVSIGANALIGACSFIKHDVPEGECWWGCPAIKQQIVPAEELI